MAEQYHKQQLIQYIHRLPPFPAVALRVLEMASDPETEIDGLLAVIEKDQAITANCLRLCNSSFLGLRQKIYSLRHALVMLGRQNLLQIVLAHCSAMPHHNQGQPGYGLRPGALWRHSVGCALLSGLLAECKGLPADPQLFVAALLHDIGKLIIDTYAARLRPARKLMDYVEETGCCLIEAEQALFGIDHAELGGMAAAAWNLPAVLTAAIRTHHVELDRRTPIDTAAWVNLSNLTYHLHRAQIIAGPSRDRFCFTLHADIPALFGIRGADLVAVLSNFPALLRSAQALLSAADGKISA